MQDKIPVVVDCDNTLGIPGCDVDDGTALIYLLGCPEVEIIGITTSYGNSTQDKVYDNTVRLLKKWKREHIPVYRGSERPGQMYSPAAEFLASMSEKYKDKLVIFCLGSTTNLAGAGKLNRNFYKNIAKISFMGGITEPLLVGGKPMSEMNMSIDWASSIEIFSEAHDIYIATAGNCLRSYFSKEQFKTVTCALPGSMSAFLKKEIQYWYDYNRNNWNLEGFINWDVMAAAQIIHPELFVIKETSISPDPESMKSGMLMGKGREIKVFLPEIIDTATYTAHVYDTYYKSNIMED